jgi:hypothetical protein
LTVAERLKAAHGPDEPPVGIQSNVTETTQVGALTVVHASVTFLDGRRFDGTSLVNLNATGPAERDAPLETCETSAIGRALAMAGYPGSEQGLAGAEELALAARRAQARPPPPTGAQSPAAQPPAKAPVDELTVLRRRYARLALRAKAKGIDAPALSPDARPDDITRAGKEVQALLERMQRVAAGANGAPGT